MSRTRFLKVGMTMLLAVLCALAGCRQDEPCDGERASLTLSTSAEALRVGESVTVTVELANRGCADLGMPQYRLYLETSDGARVLEPSPPEPVAHSLGVSPGETDSAAFALAAAGAGRVEVWATCSYEVHLGYPGPAYWGSVASRRVTLTIGP